MERVNRDNLQDYLECWGLQLTDAEEYEDERAYFLQMNVPDGDNAEGRLPETLLEALFALCHLRYTERVLCDTPGCFEAERHYHPEENRQALCGLRGQKGELEGELVRWAEGVGRQRVPGQVRIKTCFAPGETQTSSRYYAAGGEWAGTGTPYFVDESDLVEVLVFE